MTSFRNNLPKLILNTLLVVLAVLGTLLCVTTAFDLYVFVPTLLLVTVAAALLFSTCFLWKRALFALIPLGVILVLLGMFTSVFSGVMPSLRQLLHDILSRFSSAYPNLSFVIPAEPQNGIYGYTLLFSLAAILLSVWMAWGVGYRSCLISVAGTLPFLLLTVITNDTPPHVGPLILLLTAWITVLLCKERPDEPPSMDAMRVTLTLMAVLLLISVVGTVYPKDDTRDQELPEVVQKVLDQLPGPVQNVLSRDTDGIQNEELGADTSEVLDLTTQGTRDRKDTVMMQLSSTETGVLYLRGAAKDIYTGSSWESRDEAGASDCVYAHTSLGSAFGSSSQAAVQIRNYYDKATVAFTPYGFISSTGTDNIASDLRVPTNTDDYISYFWPGTATLDLTTRGVTDDSYYAYVMETCLSLPEDTKEQLYQLALDYGYDPDLGTLDTIAWVAEFVRTVGTYQLSVSRQPTNYDFAVYFLTESRKGYCVHFATAAATMLRALGLPSRYASGYRVTVDEAGAITDVLDEDTHAWAEVYLSGLGWLPLEATPGFGSSLNLPEVAHAPQEPEEEAQPSPSPEQEPEEPEDSTEEESALEPSPSPSPAAPSDEPSGTSEEPAPPEEVPETVSTAGPSRLWLLAILPVLLLLGLLILVVRHTVIRSRRKKRFADPNPNQAVIARWAYLEELVPWGLALPKPLEALALKAKFSQHEITEEELSAFSRATGKLYQNTRKSLKGLRWLRFRWIACLDLPKK